MRSEMMKKRIAALLLAFCMVLGYIPNVVRAEEGVSITVQAETVCKTEKEAANQLLEQLKAHRGSITVTYQLSGGSTPSAEALYQSAIALTGGDYLGWLVTSQSGSVKTTDGTAVYTYQIKYLTNDEQEAAVDKKVPEILKALNVSGKSDYEKVKAIYRWIYTNIKLEENGNKSISNPQLRTPYGGLIQGTCVCQGFSMVLCRLLAEVGIDSRIIPGYSGKPSGGNKNGTYSMNHFWNLIKVDGLYYNFDATWDRSLYDSEGTPKDYCMFRGDKGKFADNGTYVHIRCGVNGTGSAYNGVDYTTAAYHQAFPSSETDYVPNSTPAPTPPAEPNEQPQPIKLNSCSLSLAYTSKAYTGKKLKPAVTVKDGAKKLVSGTDYTVSYQDNQNVGTAIVTVKGKGNYTGTKKLKFTITKASGNKLTVSGKTLKKNKKKTQSFTLKVKADKSGSKLSFQSNTKKVTVNTKGKVTVKKGYSGTAKITVTATNPNYKTVKKTVKIVVKK